MALPGVEFEDTLIFTQGVASSVTKTYTGQGESCDVTISYDGQTGFSIVPSGYGSPIKARATYLASDADVSYLSFGTRKAGILPGLFSASFGEGLIAQHAWQLVAGKFNSAVNKLVALGNGSSDGARSNALTVDWDGTIEIPNSAARNKTARMLGLAKTAGDSFSVSGLRAGGYITTNKTEFAFTIPTPFRLYDVTGVTLTGSYTIRQNGNYLFGSTASAGYALQGHYSIVGINQETGQIHVVISTGATQTSATNNDTATIVLNSCTVTLS